MSNALEPHVAIRGNTELFQGLRVVLTWGQKASRGGRNHARGMKWEGSGPGPQKIPKGALRLPEKTGTWRWGFNAKDWQGELGPGSSDLTFAAHKMSIELSHMGVQATNYLWSCSVFQSPYRFSVLECLLHVCLFKNIYFYKQGFKSILMPTLQ